MEAACVSRCKRKRNMRAVQHENSPVTADSSAFTAFLLSQIRVDAIKARLRAAQITEIGLALSLGAITPTDAVRDLLDVGCALCVPSSLELNNE
jgi:hypothetical protein